MSDFKHEFRYYVIKRRDITSDQEVALQDMLHDAKIPCQESVVVENDWPNYEHTWATIQRVSDGTYDDPYAENERLRARVAELERTGSTSTSCPFCFDQMRNSYILRKQAEAVESFLSQQAPLLDRYRPQPISEEDHCCEFNLLRDRERLHSEAQRLRQQADDIQKEDSGNAG